MTFDRPWFLLGLLGLPILWLLSRMWWQRRSVTVSSLLIWKRLDLSVEPPRESRRRANLSLWLRLAAVLLAVLGMAGFRGPSAAPPGVLHVLIDDSPSMRPFGDRAREVLGEIERAVPAGTRLRVRRSPGLDDLAAVLAEAGAGDVVCITDHAPEGLESGGRARIALVGEPVENIGFASAWIEPAGEEFEFAAVLRNYGDVRLETRLRAPDGERVISLEPGEARRISGRGGEPEAELSLSPGDRFAFDDRVAVAWDEGRSLPLRWVGREQPRLRTALSVSGATFGDGAGGVVSYRVEPEDETVLLVAPPGERRDVLSGSVAVGGGLPADAIPDPGTRLGRTAVLAEGGRALLADQTGPLVVQRASRIEVGLDPGDPVSDWADDPSFPIFWQEIAWRLGAEEPRSVVVEGTMDPRESATRPAGGTVDLAGLRISPLEKEARGTALAGFLFVAAAAALVALGFIRGAKEA